MKSLFLSCVVSLLSLSHIYAQIPVGHGYDLDGNPFYGNYDEFSYSPTLLLKVYMEQDDMILGQITYQDHKKEQIPMLFRKGDLYTRHADGSASERIKAKNFLSAIIGTDSLFTISKYSKRDPSNQQVFLKQGPFICLFTLKIDHMEFAQIFGGTKSNPTSKYIFKHTGSDRWESLDFSKKGEFKRFVQKHFDPISDIVFSGPNENHTKKSTPTLIQTILYSNALKTGTLLYYDQFWNLKNAPGKAVYTAKIISFNDPIWEVDYYKSDQKLHTVHYSKLVPLIKEGLYTRYYVSGRTKSEIIFKKDQFELAKYFDSNGKIAFQYAKSVVDPYAPLITYRNSYSISYNQILNLTPNSADSIHYFDSLHQKVIYEKYENSELIDSYFMENGKQIYHFTNSNTHLKITKIQDYINFKVQDVNFSCSLKMDAQGISLLKVRVDPKGDIVSIKHLFSPNESHQLFLETHLDPNPAYLRKLGKYRINGKAVNYEVVLPIQFVRANTVPNVKNFHVDPVLLSPSKSATELPQIICY